MIIGIIGWIVVGLVVGFGVSKLVNLRGDDPRLGMAAASVGALAAALLYTMVSGTPISPWNPWSLLLATIGALVVVVAWHAVRSRTVSRAPYTRRSSYSSTGR